MFIKVLACFFCGFEGTVILIGSGSVIRVIVVGAVVFELIVVGVGNLGVVEVNQPF